MKKTAQSEIERDRARSGEIARAALGGDEEQNPPCDTPHDTKVTSAVERHATVGGAVHAEAWEAVQHVARSRHAP